MKGVEHKPSTGLRTEANRTPTGQPSPLAVRQADARGLRDITVLVARFEPMRYTLLLHKVDQEKVLLFGKRVKPLSASRKYHYLVTLRCMQFLKVESRRYYVTDYGRELSRVARYKQQHLERDERMLLARGLFRCKPATDVLGLFMPEGKPTTYEQFVDTARPIQMATLLDTRYEFIGEGGKSIRVFGQTEANLIRWGIIRLCEDIGVIDRLVFPRGHHPLSTRGHLYFPVNIQTKYDLEHLVRDLETFLRKAPGLKRDMPSIVAEICVKKRLSKEVLRSLLEQVYLQSEGRFFFEGVPANLADRDLNPYLLIGGQHRSAVYLVSG